MRCLVCGGGKMRRQILISSIILLSIQTLALAVNRYVPSRDYPTIQSAITVAANGDVVIVAPGVYTGTGNVNLDFGGKAITVKSEINPANPNPSIIAATIIDCGGQPASPSAGGPAAANRAFWFHTGEGNNSKVMGFTIRNGYARGTKAADGQFGYDGNPVSLFVPVPYPWEDDPNQAPPLALNGANASGSGYGGAILCAGASPTVQYCVISNCTVTGAQGGKGADGLSGTWDHWTIADFNTDGTLLPNAEPTENPDGQWAGSGGSGSGNGYGGAIACLGSSSPDINNCTISNNFARGGCGGNGGKGGDAASSGSPPTYQGSESGGGNAGNSRGDGIGGAIYCDSTSSPTIKNCIFSNNVATTGPRGTGGQKGLGNEADPRPPEGLDSLVFSTGGIAGGAAYYATGSHVNDTNCTFTGNKAYEAYSFYQPYYGEDISAYTVGGALYSNANNIINLDTCTFIGNLGGAVYCGPGSTVNINNNTYPSRECLFTGNSDPDDGGDLYIDVGIDFGSGGAVYIGTNCNVNLRGCIFGGNSAKNDGGALKCRSNTTLTNCSFGGNRADSDDDGDGYGGAIDAYEPGTTLTIDANACSFVGNQAIYGGGFSSENFHNTKFTNCYFIGNTARSGGGLDLVNGDFSVTGGVVKGNNATDGDGGGFDCWYTIAEINNCTISDNFADGAYPTSGNGGAINFYGGAPTQEVFNCLITGNSAAVDGGAIFCNNASPNIGNCTFSSDSAAGYGGAIFSDYTSEPNITDCIFEGCNNHAIHEEVFGGNAIVKYSLFYNNPDGDYYDSGTGLTYKGDGQIGSIPGGSNNLYGDPLFVSGPLSNFYLRQQPVQPLPQSPAVDTGSADVNDPAIKLDTYTTRTDSVGDAGQVDRGYHYRKSTDVQTFHLTASVVGGHGMVVPTSPEPVDYNSATDIYTYYAGTIVTLTTIPDGGWRIKAWRGTDDDSSTATTNTVVMNSDRIVTVEFKQSRTLIVAVGGGQPGYYSGIQDAVGDANDGDTIVVYPGIYYGAYSYFGPSVYVDKSITITSIHPDDPCCVSSTVIDGYRQSPFQEGYTNDGVIFGPHTNADTIFDGLTIQNCGGYWGDAEDGTRDDPHHPNGWDGGTLAGAAIQVSSGGGPVIKNCIIRDNVVIGGDGGEGIDADDTHNAGRGGWGGGAWGGAVYCDVNSSPTFINCQIIDNYAQGGNGGNGGNGTEDDGIANYGGNWSITGTPEYPVMDIDPDSRDITYVSDGDLWEVWNWDFAGSYWYKYGEPQRTSYLGDYRWYSAYGGGVFCDVGSAVTFIHCTISGNRTIGGVSGQGGEQPPSNRPFEPLIPYEIPTFGGGVYCAAESTITFTDCTIANNLASEPNQNNNHLDPYLGHGGGVCAEDTATLIFTNCTFSENVANVGGGTHFANANPTISDCNFISNSAFQGGGLFGEHGPVRIIGCNITNNEAASNDTNIVILGDGGGLHLWATEANIIDCNISGNQAEASGGGVFLGGENASSLTNCLLTKNTATDGGAVSTNIFAQLTISNCTIAGNTGVTSGGGLNCSYGSYANIINSIIWDNTGIYGSQIAVGTGFEYDERPSTVTISYSDVSVPDYACFHVDTNCVLSGFDPNNDTNSWDPNSNLRNISNDPNFIAGYLLRQIAAGQEVNSPCVDAGSDLASVFGLHTYTTRTDSIPDEANVDMGYHYALFTPTQYELTVRAFDINGVEDANLVDPNGGLYYAHTTVPLTVPSAQNPNFYDFNDIVWSGTNNDDSNEPNNTVTMDSNKTVTVRVTKNVHDLTVEAGPGGTVAPPWSPGIYTNIKHRTVVNLTADPDEGYRVKRWIGSDDDTSTSLSNTVTVDSDKTVRVEFEQPTTITVPGNYVDIQSAIGAARPGDIVKVSSGVYHNSMIVVNKEITVTSTNPDDPCVVASTIIDASGYADIAIVFGAGATENTVFNGITVLGDTYFRIPAPSATQSGQNGPDGGGLEGGAIYIQSFARPVIQNCIIRDANITGGNASDGGNADTTVPAGRGGWGGWARGGGIFIAPFAGPTIINTTITNCAVIGGNGGNGGNSSGTYDTPDYQDANYGGLYSNPFANFPNPPLPWWELRNSNGQPYVGDYRFYSGYGGGVYCANDCTATFIACNITNNRALGGMSGIGGNRSFVRPEPITAYRIPSYGGGVYCGANSTVTFIDCNITGNVAPKPDATYHRDPYLGHGGGIAFEDTAYIRFENCDISDNNAAIGGGMYWSGGESQVLDSNISGNVAYVGAGIYGTESTGLIQGCIVHDNFAGVSPNDVDTNVIGQGGGIYSASMESEIIDCTIIDNEATASGGGIFFSGIEASTPMVTNCLVVDNQAGRDGGGLSANWYAAPLITNCTIVGNGATGNFGEPGKTGLGGGIYSGYHSHPVILNSILWDNYALRGKELAVGTGFEYDPRPSTVDVNHSDIKGAQANAFVDVGCTLNWGAGNIYGDPCFVTGPLGNYYLSQTDTNDPNQTINSPCVNKGSDLASNVGLYPFYTTRTDEVFDINIVDMGYHYLLAHPIEQCSLCDLFRDGIVNLADYAIFSLYWLNSGCSEANGWCGGADFTFDTHVNFSDLSSFYECWLAEDTDAPVPNPSEWETAPYSSPEDPNSISMTAKAAFDAWVGVVKYYFECVTGNDSNSGWDPNRTYIRTNLNRGTVYGYRVKARDERGNETLWSVVGYVIAGEEPPPVEDHNPPTPNPMTWATTPHATSSTSIAMTATTATDDTAGVQYYFEDVNSDVNSGWWGSPTWEDTTCEPETTYTYRVKARDTSFWQNETGWSDPCSATTPAEGNEPPPDTTPPTPNPSRWATGGEPSYYQGYCEECSCTCYRHTMTAEPATDNSGQPVQYYFEVRDGCEGTHNSGWQSSNIYDYAVSVNPVQYGQYRVKTKDVAGNETTPSGWVGF